MRRATTIIPKGNERLIETQGFNSITLTREERYRRRIACKSDEGDTFLLDLAEATYLTDGSGLELDDGSIVIVRAASEDLLKVTAPDSATLMRIAWHIGNRHTPAEVTTQAIYIQPDHVLADMVRGLGGTAIQVARPFEPEGGAYGGHGSLEHGHHHGGKHHHHSHDHA